MQITLEGPCQGVRLDSFVETAEAVVVAVEHSRARSEGDCTSVALIELEDPLGGRPIIDWVTGTVHKPTTPGV